MGADEMRGVLDHYLYSLAQKLLESHHKVAGSGIEYYV